MIERYDVTLRAPAEDWCEIVISADGNDLLTLGIEQAELLNKQIAVLIDAGKSMEEIDDNAKANGESAS